MENLYKIQIVLGNFSVTIESHDKNWVEEKEKSLIGNILENRQQMMDLAKYERAGDYAMQERIPSGLTINEFQQTYIAPKSYSRPDTALLLFYFLEKIRKTEEIKTVDVRNAFKEISFPHYAKINFTDILNSLKNKGLLNKIDNHWQLTITGIDRVLSQIQNQ